MHSPSGLASLKEKPGGSLGGGWSQDRAAGGKRDLTGYSPPQAVVVVIMDYDELAGCCDPPEPSSMVLCLFQNTYRPSLSQALRSRQAVLGSAGTLQIRKALDCFPDGVRQHLAGVLPIDGSYGLLKLVFIHCRVSFRALLVAQQVRRRG